MHAVGCLLIAAAGMLMLAVDCATAQTQIAQPTALCRLWTDTCSICDRRESGDVRCNLTPRGKRSGCVAGEVRCIASDDPPAQAQIAQPVSWCLRWTDTCTTCERRRDSGEIRCTLSARGQRAGCVVGEVRCVMPDNAGLNEACQESKVIREECNSCTVPAPGRPPMCTLKLCPVKEVVCVKPRT